MLHSIGFQSLDYGRPKREIGQGPGLGFRRHPGEKLLVRLGMDFCGEFGYFYLGDKGPFG